MTYRFLISQIKSPLFIGFFFLIIFLLAVGVWYSPILFKGYPIYSITTGGLMARNIYESGLYSAENNLNVFLSSDLIKEQGQISTYGNKFTSRLYGQIFKLVGLLGENRFLLLSMTIHALSLLIFTVLVLYLFSLKTAAIFSLIYIFLPFNWQSPYGLATYEFALLFLALYFLFYLYGLDKKYNYLYLIPAGGFLALAGLSREALFVAAPAIFIYLWFKKQKRHLVYIFVPFIILFIIFWLPQAAKEGNSYLVYFLGEQYSQNKSNFLSWDQLTHLFPDPYTYYFARQEYLDKFKKDNYSSDSELITQLKTAKLLTNMGLKAPTLTERIQVGTVNLIRHLSRFGAIKDMGGPFILMLFILGFVYLRRENKWLYQLFVFWIIFTLFFLSYILLGARIHLMDFSWVIALTVALGLLFLIEILAKYFQFKSQVKLTIGLLLTLLVLYNLILSNHVLWGEVYDEKKFLITLIYAQEVNKLDIINTDVLAVNMSSVEATKLNYLTNKSVVIFAPATIEKLISQKKLRDAFDKFKVKYILGYPEELTNQILEQVQVRNIATNEINLIQPEVSRTKSWLMNLTR